MLNKKTTLWTVLAVGMALMASGSAFGAAVTWNTTTATWDTTTANWTGGATVYTNGDNATFDNTGGGGTVTISGSVAPGSTTISGSSTYTITGGSITSGALNMSGGTLILNHSNGFSAVNLSGGEIQFDNGTAPNQVLGTGVINVSGSTGKLTTGNSVGLANNIAVADGATITFDRSGAGAPYPTYSGLITGGSGSPINLTVRSTLGNYSAFSNAANSFTGTINVLGNAYFTGGPGAMGNVNNTVVLNGGTLFLGASFNYQTTHALQIAAGAGGNINGTSTWNGQITGGTNAAYLNIGGNPVFTNPSNTFSNPILLNEGWLTVTSSGAMGNSPYITLQNPQLVTRNKLTIDSPTGGTFSQNMNWAGYDLSITQSTVNWTGALTGTDNTYATNKLGNGTLVVSNYQIGSPVNVKAGTLIFNDTTHTGLGGFIVESSATLGGTGNIRLAAGKSVTIQNGGALSPGLSPGTLSMTTLNLNSGSIINLELNDPSVIGGGINDLISVSGQLTLDGIINITSLAQTGNYTVFQYGSLVDNGIDQVNFPAGLWGDVTVSGGVVVIHALPEPALVSLLGLGAAGLLLRRRP